MQAHDNDTIARLEDRIDILEKQLKQFQQTNEEDWNSLRLVLKTWKADTENKHVQSSAYKQLIAQIEARTDVNPLFLSEKNEVDALERQWKEKQNDFIEKWNTGQLEDDKNGGDAVKGKEKKKKKY